ncbi:hypothetical protein JCM11251_002549 [Rhodosporidiobolus azoricus]
MPPGPPSPVDSFFSSTTAHLAAQALSAYDIPSAHSDPPSRIGFPQEVNYRQTASAASVASPPPTYPPSFPDLLDTKGQSGVLPQLEYGSRYDLPPGWDERPPRASSTFSRPFDDELLDEEAVTPLLNAPQEYREEGHGGAQGASYPPLQGRGKGVLDGEPIGEQPADGFVAPDGGWKAWLTVLGGWLILFASFGYINAQVKPSQASGCGWSTIWVGFCRALIVVGSAMWIASIFSIPYATKYWQAIVIQAVVGGMGVGLLFLPALSVQSHWFAKKRNLAIGIVASASSSGGIAFPIMLNKLFANPSVGFANGVRYSGGVVAACLLAAIFLVSPNPARKVVRKPPPAPFRELFSVPYTLLVFAAMLSNFGLWFPNFYIQVYGQANGLDRNLSFYLLAIFNAGSFFGRTIPNMIADYTGPYLIQTLCISAGAGIVLFTMLIVKSATSIIIFAALYGFFSGGFISLVSPVIVALSNDLSEIGLRQGIATMVAAGGVIGGVGYYVAARQKGTWQV